ncbi:MAG: 6-carboxytetrahydropterin synthase QueD [Candidatus Omnitrophica bacterium]|nr:6-carboxytetrahydropterin synthase QueD [Candidatus Omnitrophota bacterium]MDD5771717.1 6-carboxytetrahydropterin synthase QueD [Candidatus Omnitrophota bacterium]
MYSLKVDGGFSSAHNLRGYKGKCEDLHGHNWRVEICISSKKLDNIGMVLDFKYLKMKLNAFLEKLDHKYLNKLNYFKKVNPTSENIARYIYDQLKPGIPLLSSVTVWENSTSSATYVPDAEEGAR